MGNGNRTSGGGDGGGGGGDDTTPFEFDVGLGLNSEPSYPCKKTSFISHSYSTPYHHQNYHHHQGSESGGELFVNQTDATNRIPSVISFNSTTDRAMAASGKVLFTANQWQELERQTMIYKYIMASVPVPPQLLLPLSTQSNRVSTGLRFSNGSDPEPWRCRRTDGKKWRCSRDVARDQKYCEHHAHKTRPRSRKPVENQSHNTKHNHHTQPQSTINNNINNNNNNYDSNPKMLSLANSSNKQTSDWYTNFGTIGGSKRGQTYKEDFKGNDQNNNINQYLNTSGFDTSANDLAASARTQHFIDSWSRIGNGDDCSLSLSMQSSGNGIEFNDHESFQIEWLNHGSWAGSTPGGPLAEALCLGIDGPASTQPPNMPSSFH